MLRKSLISSLKYYKFVNNIKHSSSFINNSSRISTVMDGTTKNTSVLIIDVREPLELNESGSIPNSINIPLPVFEDVLKNYSEDQFKKEFGRGKPSKDTTIILSCRSGKRADTALGKAKALGYNNLQLYQGSWLDWEHNIKKD